MCESTLVDVKFNYPKTGFPFKVEKASFEKIMTEKVNEFFDQRKTLKEPEILELNITKEGKVTPRGYIFEDKTLKELIEELKEMIKNW